MVIPFTRRLMGAALVALLVWSGCEIAVGSYTKRHCDAFSEAWSARDPAVGEELLALTTPPEGETIEPAVHDAALRLAAGALGVDLDALSRDERVDALLAECAKVPD